MKSPHTCSWGLGPWREGPGVGTNPGPALQHTTPPASLRSSGYISTTHASQRIKKLNHSCYGQVNSTIMCKSGTRKLRDGSISNPSKISKRNLELTEYEM